MGRDTVLIVPEPMRNKAEKIGKYVAVKPGEIYDIDGLEFETVPAYNIGKPFHPKSADWVGYILKFDGDSHGKRRSGRGAHSEKPRAARRGGGSDPRLRQKSGRHRGGRDRRRGNQKSGGDRDRRTRRTRRFPLQRGHILSALPGKGSAYGSDTQAHGGRLFRLSELRLRSFAVFS